MRRFAASASAFVRRLRLSASSLGAGGMLALAAVAGPARADPPLWTVPPQGGPGLGAPGLGARGQGAPGQGAEIDLFGSIHLLSDTTHWRSPAFDAELAKADAVWFEIPIGGDDQAQATQLLLSRGTLPQGQTLSTVLPPPLWARVSALAAREGLAPAVLQRMRPWLAELELTILFYQRQGYREDLGVEHQVDLAAPKTARREAFETLAEQVDLFADDPLPEQIASLKETLDEIDTDPNSFNRAADAWRRGDVKALQHEVVDQVRKEDEGLYRRLLVDRNRRFATRIEQMARSGQGHIFVVVGAGHLVGPDGVPAMLRRDGFKVEGP